MIRYVYILFLLDWLSVASSLIDNVYQRKMCCIIHTLNLRYMVLFHHGKHFIFLKAIPLVTFTGHVMITRRCMLPPVPVSRFNGTRKRFRERTRRAL